MSARTLLSSVEQDARAAHRRGHVDLLHELAAGIMAEAGEMTGRIFVRLAHVEAIERARAVGRKRGGFARVRDGERRRDRRHRGRCPRHPRTCRCRRDGRRHARGPCLASVQPMVPLRSARTLLGRPALISDWVPMIERVRPAQLTMMVVSGSGAASTCAQHQLRAGHADRARDIHGRIFVEPADIEDGDVGLVGDQRRRPRPRASDGVWRRASTSSPKALA